MPSRRSLQVTTPSDREIVVVRDFEAPRRQVFDAFTRPDLVKRWLYGPEDWQMAVCEIDFREGGAFRYVWRHAGGSEMGLSGVYREIVPTERIVSTELFDEDWTGGETVVTTVFAEQAGTTTVTITVLYSSREARDGALATPMAEGMEMSYTRLDKLLPTLG